MAATTTAASAAAAEHPSDAILPDPITSYLQHEFSLPDELITPEEREVAKRKLLEKVEEDAMAPYYRRLCKQFEWPLDEELIEKLEKSNKLELEGLEAAIEDAKQNYGDVEIRDALFRKAHFYCRIRSKEAAISAYSDTFEKTIGAGSRLDIIHTLVRLGLLMGDQNLAKKSIERAKSELERGGDWERMNKLKVYEALQLTLVRRFKEAANLLLDSIATFTATEILDFEKFVFHTIILSMLTLDRPVLKSRVINSPEVLQVVANDTDLKEFLISFYQCNYATFMTRLIPVSTRVRRDRYLGPHYRYFIRNIRLRAYMQFLEPYKSVTIRSMSEAFGVPQAFIEEEVSSFIAGGRLNSKIDRVSGVIESNRPDARDALYLQTLKEGDALLNKIQKLSRVIDM